MHQDHKPEVDMVEKGDKMPFANPHDSTTVSFKQALKDNPKAMICSFLMAMGPLAFGFDIIIVGVVTAFPAFL